MRADSRLYISLAMGEYFLAVDLESFGATHQVASLLRASQAQPKAAIRAAFREVSRAVDLTIMQSAGCLRNFEIVFRRVLCHRTYGDSRERPNQYSIQTRQIPGFWRKFTATPSRELRLTGITEAV
jgi:hypothetical protein